VDQSAPCPTLLEMRGLEEKRVNACGNSTRTASVEDGTTRAARNARFPSPRTPNDSVTQRTGKIQRGSDCLRATPAARRWLPQAFASDFFRDVFCQTKDACSSVRCIASHHNHHITHHKSYSAQSYRSKIDRLCITMSMLI